MCIYCGNIYKNHSSELANASDVLKAGVLGTNQDLANYLTSGFWHELEAYLFRVHLLWEYIQKSFF